MRRVTKLALITVLAGSLAAGGTLLAFASTSWPVSFKPTKVKLAVAKMPKGAAPSVAQSGSTAVVSLSAQEIQPGVLMDHYTVIAHDVAGARAGVTHVVTASGAQSETVTFAASELAGTTWQWTVTPRFKNWVGDASPLSKPKLTFPAGTAVPFAAGPIAPVPAPAPTAVPQKAQPTTATPPATAPTTPTGGPTTPDPAPPTPAATRTTPAETAPTEPRPPITEAATTRPAQAPPTTDAAPHPPATATEVSP